MGSCSSQNVAHATKKNVIPATDVKPSKPEAAAEENKDEKKSTNPDQSTNRVELSTEEPRVIEIRQSLPVTTEKLVELTDKKDDKIENVNINENISENVSEVNVDGSYNLGDSVSTTYGEGIIKWIGKCKYFSDSYNHEQISQNWFGIKLINKNESNINKDKVSLHNGLYKGRRFFISNQNNAIYIQKCNLIKKIEPLSDDNVANENSKNNDNVSWVEYLRSKLIKWRKEKHGIDSLNFIDIPSDCKVYEHETETYKRWLYDFYVEGTFYRVLEFESKQMVLTTFTLDYSGCENYKIESPLFGKSENNIVIAKIQPFEKIILSIISRNMSENGKLARKGGFKFSFAYEPFINDINKQFINQKIENEFNDKNCFVDPLFYPSYVTGKGENEDCNKKFIWKRAIDFCKPPKYFSDGIDVSDAKQGQLGDCWFISSLSSLAEHPQLIEKMFISSDSQYDTPNTNLNIKHVLNLYHNGILTKVTLDDYFPCNPGNGGPPIYTRCKDNELWVALIEKAYAKLNGCYFNLIRGNPTHALCDLTGYPCKMYNFVHDNDFNSDTFWNELLNWCKINENIMVTTTTQKGGELGLSLTHAYSLLDAKEYNNIKLVEIRNPWGFGEWKGDYSDNSNLWTDELKKAFGIENFEEDGKFWMSYQDFITYFRDVGVCFADTKFYDNRIAVDLKYDKIQIIELQVFGDSTVEWLGVYQQDTRETNAPDYIDICVFVFDGEFNCIGYTKGNIHQNRQVFEKLSLSEGIYYVIPYTSSAKWDINQTGNTRKIALSIHGYNQDESTKCFNMTLCKNELEYKNDVLNDLLSIVMNDVGKWNSNGEYETGFFYNGPLLLYGIRNNHRNRSFVMSMKFEINDTNFKFIGTFENNKEVTTLPLGGVNILNGVIRTKHGHTKGRLKTDYNGCKWGDVQDTQHVDKFLIPSIKKKFVQSIS